MCNAQLYVDITCRRWQVPTTVAEYPLHQHAGCSQLSQQSEEECGEETGVKVLEEAALFKQCGQEHLVAGEAQLWLHCRTPLHLLSHRFVAHLYMPQLLVCTLLVIGVRHLNASTSHTAPDPMHNPFGVLPPCKHRTHRHHPDRCKNTPDPHAKLQPPNPRSHCHHPHPSSHTCT